MDKLFNTKRTYIGYDGDEYIDMSIPVVSVSKISGRSTERTNQDDNGRLDNFVWRSVAKNLDMIDITMYANHIFNPFAVKEDEILYVPMESDGLYDSSSEPSLPDGTKYSDNSSGTGTKSYAETVAYLAKKGLGIK